MKIKFSIKVRGQDIQAVKDFPDSMPTETIGDELMEWVARQTSPQWQSIPGGSPEGLVRCFTADTRRDVTFGMIKREHDYYSAVSPEEMTIRERCFKAVLFELVKHAETECLEEADTMFYPEQWEWFTRRLPDGMN